MLVDVDVVVGEAVEDDVTFGFFVEIFTLFVFVKDTPYKENKLNVNQLRLMINKVVYKSLSHHVVVLTT